MSYTSAPIPDPRIVTRADDRIDFAACLKAARAMLGQRMRSTARMARSPIKPAVGDFRVAMLGLASLVEEERQAWAAVSPSTRAAATHFDSLVPAARCACSASRADAIVAIAADYPAVWDSLPSGPQNPFVGLINGGAGRAQRERAQGIIFGALIAYPGASAVDTLTPLNEGGRILIKAARMGRAGISSIRNSRG